jgi:Restriction endonuclease
MSRYDFEQLSPYDFELVVRDLLRAEWHVQLETFTHGRDRGMDIRYLGAPEGQLDRIVQCKKFKPDAYVRLRRELKQVEVPKIRALAPGRYVLATSVELTPKRKEELAAVLQPWVISEGDLLGRDDLNNRLRDYPRVEAVHFKLWLSSTAVLARVLHSDIYNRSQWFRDQVQQTMRTYVPNRAYGIAKRILDDLHVCIISGDPGIGKTTLATMLAVAYLNEGDWDVFPIYNDIGDAERVWSSDSSQLFYYDDFLGRVALSDMSLAKNEDRRLLDFMAQVGRTNNKRLLLTTREYIFAAAQLRYDRLSDDRVALSKYIMRPVDYTKWERALILYNHLYMSPLEEQAKVALLDSGGYLEIVQHRNYSPRLIDYITHSRQAQRVAGSEFAAFAIRVLDDPEELWWAVMERDLDVQGRAILLCLASLPVSVHLDDLERCSDAYVRQSPIRPTLAFRQALRVLEGASFIKISRLGSATIIAMRDAAVLDFVLGWLSERRQDAAWLVQSLVFFEQCTTLADYVWTANLKGFAQ